MRGYWWRVQDQCCPSYLPSASLHHRGIFGNDAKMGPADSWRQHSDPSKLTKAPTPLLPCPTVSVITAWISIPSQYLGCLLSGVRS